MLGASAVSTEESRRAAANVWLRRRNVEIEAATLFRGMARSMERFSWPSVLVDAAIKAAEDECVHAELCDSLVSILDPALVKSTIPEPRAIRFKTEIALLHTAVSVGCVTESMSCALLIRMKKSTTDSDCKRVVSAVLRDEVSHSRIGWESLRHCNNRMDVRWVQTRLSQMCQMATTSEIADLNQSHLDLSLYGILPKLEGARIVEDTINEVIVPGVATVIGEGTRHGLALGAG